MSKSQSSNVDCRCDGAEMSVRDQRVGTSYSDRVKEDVSQEYFTCRNKFYIPLRALRLLGKRRVGWVGGILQRASEAFHPPCEELWWGG